MYLVLSAFTPSPISLVATTKAYTQTLPLKTKPYDAETGLLLLNCGTCRLRNLFRYHINE